MKRSALVLSIFLLAAPVRAAAPMVDLVKGDKRIDVVIGGSPFTSYLYGDNLTKPVLVPVRTPSGIEISRRYPLVEIPGGSTDHAHHEGIFFAVDQVNGVNFWRNADPPPQIRHAKITEMASGPGEGKLFTVANWVDDKDRTLLEEKRTMLFSAGRHDREYAIDLSIDLKAVGEDVLFEDIEEGMFAIRVSDYLRESDLSKTLRPGETLPKESVAGTGIYFSSNGDETAKNAWGKRARWVALQGVRKGKVVGVAILNHPASINYPTYWHVRNYGLFSANPLGQGDFQRQMPRKYRKNKVMPLNLTLEPGETTHFRFLVIVYEGIRTAEQIDKRFRQFVK
ncbi:MAG: PmoA family protein [Phycisphaerales bacterium]|nr:MAG: PmoA family protein [Phycisphaerales bacterium]